MEAGPAAPDLHQERARGENSGGLGEHDQPVRESHPEGLQAHAAKVEGSQRPGAQRRRSRHGRVRSEHARRRARRRRMMKNPKLENRMPKEIRNPNAKSSNSMKSLTGISLFRISNFGSRISA